MSRRVKPGDLLSAWTLYNQVGGQAAGILGISRRALYFRVNRYCDINGLVRKNPHRNVMRQPQYVKPLPPPPASIVNPGVSNRALSDRLKMLEKRVIQLEQTRKDPPGFMPSSLRVKDGGINRKKQRQAFHVVRVNA